MPNLRRRDLGRRPCAYSQLLFQIVFPSVVLSAFHFHESGVALVLGIPSPWPSTPSKSHGIVCHGDGDSSPVREHDSNAVLDAGLPQDDDNCCTAASNGPTRMIRQSWQQQPRSNHQHSSLYRGALLSENATAAELYQAYAAVRHNYTELLKDEASSRSANDRESDAGTSWTVLADRHCVRVSLRPHPGDPACPYVKIEVRLPAPMDVCWEFLDVAHWDENLPVMDPFYEGLTVYDKERTVHPDSTMIVQQHDYGPVQMMLCRKRMKRLFAFGKRDMTFLSVAEDAPNDQAKGVKVSATVAVCTPTVPRQPGYTRAFQESLAIYTPVKGGEETDLRIVCRIDLNDSSAEGGEGCVPMWLYVKTVGTTAASSMHKLRRALLRHQQRQQDQRK